MTSAQYKELGRYRLGCSFIMEWVWRGGDLNVTFKVSMELLRWVTRWSESPDAQRCRKLLLTSNASSTHRDRHTPNVDLEHWEFFTLDALGTTSRVRHSWCCFMSLSSNCLPMHFSQPISWRSSMCREILSRCILI